MTTAPPPTAPPRASRRRLRIALAVIVALFATLAAIWWYLDWSAERDFQAALAETDALDPGWRLEDILAARAVIPDEQNSALIVAKVYSPLAPGYSFTALDNEIEKQSSSQTANFLLSPRLIMALRKRLVPLAPARIEVQKLSDMPDGRLIVDYERVAMNAARQSLYEHHEVLILLNYDMVLRINDGDPLNIALACRALINLARAIGDEPSIIAVRMRIIHLEGALYSIERALAQSELPPDELRTLQVLLKREMEEPKFLRAMRGERATGLRIVEAIRDGRIKRPRSDTTPGWRAWVGDWLPSSSGIDRAAYLRAMNDLVETSKLPMADQIDAFQSIDDAWKDRDAVLAPLVSMCARTGIDAQFRNQAKLRCAMAALAAERYRQERGFWPKSLENLVESHHLLAVPDDPYIGKPLRFRRMNDGFLVYSVGADRTDNGGIRNYANPIAPGADIGFQMWDVPFRGLPAPPPE